MITTQKNNLNEKEIAEAIKYYTDLITSQHKDAPKYLKTVELSVSALAQGKSALKAFIDAFDLDFAVGKQLDILGEWIGQSRNIYIDLLDTYFAFDDAEFAGETGWDEGIWKQDFDIEKQVTALDDSTYRKILYFKIAKNKFNGTAESVYNAFDNIFGGKYYLIVIDNLDMSFKIAITGDKLSNLDKSLIAGGYLSLKPFGVRVNEISFAPFDGQLFAFDIENEALKGWDKGQWGEFLKEQPAAVAAKELMEFKK